jgi:hypothetical protein
MPVADTVGMLTAKQTDRRRHPRTDVSWLVVVEAGKRRFLLQTVDISARGAKVRPKERLDIGTPAQLRFRPPDGSPFNVPALVWRADSDGLAFLFMGDIQDRLRRFGRVLAV